MISEFEEDDFKDTSRALFDNTKDEELGQLLVDLGSDYSEDDESDEDIASGNHFRRSYDFRNRPHQETKGKELQQRGSKPTKRKKSQSKGTRTQYERKSSTSQNRNLHSTR